MKIRAQAEPWMAGVSFAIFDDEGTPLRAPDILEKLARGSYAVPFATISMEQAQTVLNDLWHMGLRPSNGEGSVGELKATQNHLADVRKLLSEKMKVAL